MADKATADSVAADIRPPEYRKAVQLMRHDIKKKKDRISGINGEIADVWGKISGHRVTKPAGRIFMALDAMEDDERHETLRCLNGLIDASGWPEPDADIADIAEGRPQSNRVGPSAADEELDALERDQEGGGDPPPAKSMTEALERSRARLGGAAGETKPLH